MNFLSWVLAVGMVLLVLGFFTNQVLTIVYRIKHKGYQKKDLLEVLDVLKEAKLEALKENKKEEEEGK